MSTFSTQQQLARIQQLQQLGNLDEAERLCRAALLSAPNSHEFTSILGVVLSQRGEHKAAAQLLSKAVALAPDNYIYLFNLGTVHAACEEYQEAERFFKQGLALSPSTPEGHYNLGNALKDQGRLEEAVASYRKAIQLRSSYAAAWSNLGSAYIQLTKLPDAKSAIQRALALNPKSPSALNNLANIARNEGDLAGSIQHAVNALALNPNFADAYFTLGSALIASLDFRQAIIAYEKGASLKPASKSVLFELVNAYSSCGAHSGIVDALGRVLAIDPKDARAAMFLGITQMERGYYDEARAAFENSIEIADVPATRVRKVLAIPPIVSSASEIVELRKKLDRELDALSVQDGVINDPYSAQIGPNFFLAYHGENNRDVQQKIAGIYRKYCPSLNFVAPHCVNPAPRKPRLKVGFISKFIYRHSVAISFGRMICEMSLAADLDVHLISTTDCSTAAVKEMYSEFKGTFVCIPASVEYARQALSVLELDVLIYLDIGMDPLTFLLAFARLAPVQCVMGGHPDTTGIDTVDYYISASQAEPEDAQQHYSETLVPLSTGMFNFPRPTVPSIVKSKAELGLPIEGHIYFCPMMLQKLHPEFDTAVGKILELDPSASVVFCESFQHVRWGELVRERLDRALPAAVRNRVKFIPWIHDNADFLGALSQSDVILDPFHFGIGTTGAFSMAVGTPIVTRPGKYMRGRVGLMYCLALDLMECVAESTADYAEKAVKIATDQELRAQIKRKILKNSPKIFDIDQSNAELTQFIRSATPVALKKRVAADTLDV